MGGAFTTSEIQKAGLLPYEQCSILLDLELDISAGRFVLEDSEDRLPSPRIGPHHNAEMLKLWG